ncbi:hypothetical protein ACOZ06_000855 [Cronobacter muytjensii]
MFDGGYASLTRPVKPEATYSSFAGGASEAPPLPPCAGNKNSYTFLLNKNSLNGMVLSRRVNGDL